MKLYDLGHVPGHDSITVFHALAYLGEEALVVVSPQDPIVGLGFFQDAGTSVDLAYCKEAGIGVMRREIGGGTVYLDGDQVFYQVVMSRDNPLASGSISSIYRRFSAAPINTYKRLGVQAEFRPVNDIVTLQGRKIAGEGGGDIGTSRVFVGGLLLDFDYRAMSRVLKVPDEKFRDKIYKTMEENLTTVSKETGSKPDRSDVVKILVEEFTSILGEMVPAELSSRARELMREIEDRLSSPEALFLRSRDDDAAVRISSSVQVLKYQHKAPGGLITTLFEVKDGRIHDLNIWGDFTLLPANGLEEMQHRLEGVDYGAAEIERRLRDLWQDAELDFPGVSLVDIVSALGL